jgi:hypothetical protein
MPNPVRIVAFASAAVATAPRRKLGGSEDRMVPIGVTDVFFELFDAKHGGIE